MCCASKSGKIALINAFNNGLNDYVKGVSHSDKFTETYHQTVLFPCSVGKFSFFKPIVSVVSATV